MQAGTMQASIQNIVVDLEFAPTPKDVKHRGLGKEIIEVGAVKLDAAGNVAGTFCRYVKPAYIEHIAPKIVKLTGIHDADVRDAEPIEAVIEQFADWAGPRRTRLAAWSGSDKDQVQKECAFKNIELPSQMRHWIDLQRIYPRLMGVGDGRRSMALRTAADWTGAGLDVSSAHRALYDAQVTAELMSQLLTGEYRQQKQALAQNMGTPDKGELTTSLGSMCAGLEDLYRQLLAQGCSAN